MKRLLSLALVFALVLAMSVPALAAGNLYSTANEWYYTAESNGIVTVSDNKEAFTYEVSVGDNFLGLQNDYVGQLEFLGFEHVCVWVEITVEPTCTLQGYTTNVCEDDCGAVWGYWWNYTDELGHDFASYTWDGWGWWASDCSRCDWEGYISYDPNFFKTEGEIKAGILEALSDTEISAGLSLSDGVLTLTIGDNVFVLVASGANNVNVTGEIDLGDGWFLVFDIAGNGSNIKGFYVEYRG